MKKLSFMQKQALKFMKEYVEEHKNDTYQGLYDDIDEDWDDDDDEDDEVEFDEGFYKSVRKPAGCRACGGDYPRCCDACPMFDD